MPILGMATVNQALCVGCYTCSSLSKIEDFYRIPTPQNSCRASMVLQKSSSSRIGFSSKAHVYGFRSKAMPFRALQSEEESMHPGSPSCMEEQAFSSECRPWADQAVPINRRAATTLLLFTFSISADWVVAADEEVKPLLNLETYTDEKEGFTILRPTQWNKIDKAGATVLFEDPQSKGNNVGVVVNPVRISSLDEFGTVDVVADKLLQAEKRKPSTNDVQLIKVNERQVHGGASLYQLEYKLDSSRGVKRILSAVTVASRKLYILNVAYADSLEKPLLPDTASVLEKIANSFDVLN